MYSLHGLEILLIEDMCCLAALCVICWSGMHRFYTKLDILLNEDVLIGKSRACQETLRPPAASTLAELIVHVRADLTLQQIQRIVYMFSRSADAANTVLLVTRQWA